jgi:hypothetical protein
MGETIKAAVIQALERFAAGRGEMSLNVQTAGTTPIESVF